MSSEVHTDTLDSWAPWSPDAPKIEDGSEREYSRRTFGVSRRSLSERNGRKGFSIKPEECMLVVRVLRADHPMPVSGKEICRRTGLSQPRFKTILDALGDRATIYRELGENKNMVYYGLLHRDKPIVDIEI